MRFYGIDALQLLKYPAELLAHLARCIEPLNAEAYTWELLLARAAFRFSKEDAQSLIKNLAEKAQPYEDEEIIQVMPETADWFEANGIPHKIIDA